jgi:hypothetical protein
MVVVSPNWTRQQTSGRAGRREAIGHATGTQPETGLMKIIYGSLEMASDLAILGSAPSATRTRDLLLRRQLLYPLSYRG